MRAVRLAAPILGLLERRVPIDAGVSLSETRVTNRMQLPRRAIQTALTEPTG